MGMTFEKGTLVKCRYVESMLNPIIGRVLNQLGDTVIIEVLHYSEVDRIKLKRKKYLLELKIVHCEAIKIRKMKKVQNKRY
ncbi:hypothetical protein [Pediococcus claussenii]|nr:hypothetical protein [Pediococcus claussenii]ANZ68805.1 hypothetical protein AYR57_00045 [Pediococcus claussenii]ANZ70621.1 hypothetical protein AYR58_00045 [Pediococcus claussenii]